MLLGRRHGNSVFCGGRFAGLYSQRATQTAQQPTTNDVHIRQKAPLLFFAQIAVQGNHAVKVESGGVKPIPMRDHVGGTVTRRSVGLAVVGVILVKICLCALLNDGAQRRACIHAVADINRAVLGNILRLDAVRQTVRDLDRHRAALDGRGDHGCEYMTGGTVVVLGKTGKNFAAGMSGGIAYVLDEDWDFYTRVNKDMVSLEPVEHKYDVSLLKDLIREHVEATGSPRGKEILDNFGEYLPKFKKVLPHDYDKMLRLIAQMEEKGEDSEQAQIEAFYAMKNAANK